MDKNVLDLWLKALRSGEYKQGTGLLYSSSDDSFCCLGVLASELGYSKEDLDGAELPEDLGGYFDTWPLRGAGGSPPVQLKTSQFQHAHTLSSVNDNTGWSFEQIANLIEEQADKL